MDDIDSDRNRLVVAILQLFEAEPSLCLLRRDDSKPSTAQHTAIPSMQSLVTFRPHDQTQIFALLACLMQEDNHRHVQDTVVDLLLLLQQVSLLGSESQNESNALEIIQQQAERRNFHANMDMVVLAIARPCLTSQDTTEGDKTSLKAFMTFLQRLATHSRDQESPADWLEATLCLAEMIGFLQLCSANGELKALGMGILQAACAISSERDETSTPTNINTVAAAIQQESGPVVGGHVAQMKRLMKIFRSITHFSTALSAAWAELYIRWNKCGGVFGMQGFENQVDKSVGGIEMSFMQVVSPNEVSFMTLCLSWLRADSGPTVIRIV